MRRRTSPGRTRRNPSGRSGTRAPSRSSISGTDRHRPASPGLFILTPVDSRRRELISHERYDEPRPRPDQALAHRRRHRRAGLRLLRRRRDVRGTFGQRLLRGRDGHGSLQVGPCEDAALTFDFGRARFERPEGGPRMTENIAPSQQILTGAAARAYEAHALKRAGAAGTALVRVLSDRHFNGLISIQDAVWDLTLDFTAPLEPYVRDELRAAGTGLPWGSRLDVEFYWKFMYAAHVDSLTDDHADEFQGQALRRPIKETVAVVANLLTALRAVHGENVEACWRSITARGSGPIGYALYQGV